MPIAEGSEGRDLQEAVEDSEAALRKARGEER